MEVDIRREGQDDAEKTKDDGFDGFEMILNDAGEVDNKENYAGDTAGNLKNGVKNKNDSHVRNANGSGKPGKIIGEDEANKAEAADDKVDEAEVGDFFGDLFGAYLLRCAAVDVGDEILHMVLL